MIFTELVRNGDCGVEIVVYWCNSVMNKFGIYDKVCLESFFEYDGVGGNIFEE